MEKTKTLKDYKYYIAGLFEGDGHVGVPAPDIAKRALPRGSITAHVQDLPAIEHLKELLGHGFIRNKVKENAVVWTVGNREGLFKLIDGLNGKLYTPKVNDFNRVIDGLNKEDKQNFVKLELTDPTLNNSGFSGFVDADGCFYLRATQVSSESSNKKERFSARMTIDQRMVSPEGVSYEPIMNLIAETFKCRLSRTAKKNGNTYFTLTADTTESLELLIDYFGQHPLLSSKYLDYKCGSEAIKIRRYNKILSKSDKENILFLKKQMNNERKLFSGQHLPALSNIKREC